MQQIRPYSLIQKTLRSQDVPAPEGEASTFSRELGEERALPDDGDGTTEDLEYLAAELAVRQSLTTPELDETQTIQVAHFLSQQRRSGASPLRAGRLGGVVKAAMQSRIGVPPTSAPPTASAPEE